MIVIKAQDDWRQATIPRSRPVATECSWEQEGSCDHNSKRSRLHAGRRRDSNPVCSWIRETKNQTSGQANPGSFLTRSWRNLQPPTTSKRSRDPFSVFSPLIPHLQGCLQPFAGIDAILKLSRARLLAPSVCGMSISPPFHSAGRMVQVFGAMVGCGGALGVVITGQGWTPCVNTC